MSKAARRHEEMPNRGKEWLDARGLNTRTWPTLYRHWEKPSERITLWCDLATGLLVHQSGAETQIDVPVALADILAHPITQDVRVVYLTGGYWEHERPRAEWFFAAKQHGWQVTERFTKQHTAKLRADDGREIDVRMTTTWFGDIPTTPQAARDAHHYLAHELRALFGEHAHVWMTPARTGLDTLERSLPFDRWYPILPEEERHLLYANFGQGRSELLVSDTQETIPGFLCLDCRFAYAFLLRHTPQGPFIHDTHDEFVPYKPGFYRARITIPHDWAHIGLLPYWDEHAWNEHTLVHGKTIYPSEGGHTFETWAGEPELRIALDAANGWKAQVLERLYFPEETSEPLKEWGEKLVGLREGLVSREAGDAASLVRGATRAILLGAIGSFHSHHQTIDRWADDDGDLPDDEFVFYEGPREGGFHWRETREITGEMTRFQHPEWSAHIWSRMRAHSAKQALALPRSTLGAIRTDALWLYEDPHVIDSGKPGGWRIKGNPITSTRRAPHTMAELQTLMDEVNERDRPAPTRESRARTGGV